MNKTAEKARITACKRILRNAKKSNEGMRRAGMYYRDYLQYANTVDGVQYVCDGYRIVAFKNPLPLEGRPDNVALNCDLVAHLQENIDDNSIILTTPDKKALKAYIKEYKEKQISMGVKLVTPPIYNFGRKLPAVNSEYLLGMMNIFPDGTFYANNECNIFVEDKEGNRGKLLGMRKPTNKTNAGATKL